MTLLIQKKTFLVTEVRVIDNVRTYMVHFPIT